MQLRWKTTGAADFAKGDSLIRVAGGSLAGFHLSEHQGFLPGGPSSYPGESRLQALRSTPRGYLADLQTRETHVEIGADSSLRPLSRLPERLMPCGAHLPMTVNPAADEMSPDEMVAFIPFATRQQ